MNTGENSLPIEQFVQALTTQLDRAQSAMALKARNLKLPLTFAVKDLQLELRTHVEMVRSEVRIRPAGPGDADASMLHLSLTTITRPMIEENAVEFAATPDDPTVKEALGDQLTEEEQRRLEWAGVNTIRQLRDLDRRKGTEAVQRVAQLPVDRLRAALKRAAQPHVSRIMAEATSEGMSVAGDASHPPRLRIQGHNLLGENRRPTVRIAGQEVPVVEARDSELIVAPLAHQLSGDLIVETDAGLLTVQKLDLGPSGVSQGHGGPS